MTSILKMPFFTNRNCRLFAQLLFPSHKPDNNQQQNHQFFNYPNNHQPRRFSQSSSSAASFTINRKSKMPAFTYPEVRRDESSVETLHGVEVFILEYILYCLATNYCLFFRWKIPTDGWKIRIQGRRRNLLKIRML